MSNYRFSIDSNENSFAVSSTIFRNLGRARVRRANQRLQRRNRRQWDGKAIKIDHRFSAKRLLLPSRWNRTKTRDSFEFVHRSFVTLLTRPRFILSILDACRGNLARSPMLKEIIPTCHFFQFFKDRSLSFLTVLDVDFSRVNSKTFETSFLERRNGTRIANKIGVTARVHSRFACSRGVHKAARSWPSITACYPQRQQIGPP